MLLNGSVTLIPAGAVYRITILSDDQCFGKLKFRCRPGLEYFGKLRKNQAINSYGAGIRMLRHFITSESEAAFTTAITILLVMCGPSFGEKACNNLAAIVFSFGFIVYTALLYFEKRAAETLYGR